MTTNACNSLGSTRLTNRANSSVGPADRCRNKRPITTRTRQPARSATPTPNNPISGLDDGEFTCSATSAKATSGQVSPSDPFEDLIAMAFVGAVVQVGRVILAEATLLEARPVPLTIGRLGSIPFRRMPGRR